MKRTWIVTVGMGIGHELHNVHDEMEIYGPYTQKVAEKLAADLNAELDSDDAERPVATAEPIDCTPARLVLREYRSRLIDREPDVSQLEDQQAGADFGAE
jgi:hypothetical protein